jgi:phosphoserine phosphatase
MKIGLFLDVDKTLTKHFIQHEYAKLIGCEESYTSIENEFQNKKITSTQFGEKIIDVFKNRKFTKDFAIQNFEKVELTTWADKLLRVENVDKYLISSGPSYYIDELARKYDIPSKMVCRSEYVFDEQTKCIKECHAINDQQKADFVRSKIGKYDISIGIGDHPEFDGPFISLCTIPMLTVRKEGYLYVSSFSTAVSMIERIASVRSEFEPRIELDRMTSYYIIKHMTLKSWGILISIIFAAFSAGMIVQKFPTH